MNSFIVSSLEEQGNSHNQIHILHNSPTSCGKTRLTSPGLHGATGSMSDTNTLLRKLRASLEKLPLVETAMTVARPENEWIHHFSQEAGSNDLREIHEFVASAYPREYLMLCTYHHFEILHTFKMIRCIRQQIIKTRIIAAIDALERGVPDVIGSMLSLRLALEHIGAHAMLLKRRPVWDRTTDAKEAANTLHTYAVTHLASQSGCGQCG